MSAINFPNNPDVNDEFTVNDIKYVWDGVKWSAFSEPKVGKTSDTGSAIIPTGDEAERDSNPDPGFFRFNTDTDQFEGYNGTDWGEIGGGGGATGGDNDQVFFENDQTITASYTITEGKNAMSTGPVEIDDGVVVTVPTGSRWVVL
jgi:hypothetical protein